MYKGRFVFLAIAVFVAVFSAMSVCQTKIVKASTMTSASVTMSNSRMSFKAPISSGAAGTSLITISGSAPDTTTKHLFPGDKVCFTDAGNNVCRDNTTYTVDSIVSNTQFNITSPLTTALTATDYAVASQSGSWTIAFTTINTVPIGGKLTVTIPGNDDNTAAQNNDGMPDSDTNTTNHMNGFDMNKLAVGNITVTGGCTPANWGTAGAATSITVGGSGTDTVISWTRGTSTCAGGTPITVGIASPFVVNPAPITGHTQGQADTYGITVTTTDGTNTIDTAVPKVAPVEAVLVSGTVDETLSFTITGANSATTHCGNSQTVTTTATSVPWGHFATTNTFYYASQNIVVSTNAASGYTVTAQENDQMGKGGAACPGATPSVGDYTFTAGIYCIRDTICSAATPCSSTVMGDWPAASSYGGLGYSLATTAGSPAPFYYNQGGRTFNSKTFPDMHDSGSVQTIMTNSGPTGSDGVDVCYKIAIPGSQPSGYYYNIVKYTATATF